MSSAAAVGGDPFPGTHVKNGGGGAAATSADAGKGDSDGSASTGEASNAGGPDIMNGEVVRVKLSRYTVLGTTFDVDERYVILDSVGQGAYGVVCAARDDKTGKMVAIKKIHKAFEHHTFTKCTLREVKLLRMLKHENVINLCALLWPVDLNAFEDLYVVFELMETDLASIIKSPQPLTDEHCQFFLYQILRGLKYLHSARVIHRDLKPRNLLVNSNCDLKICDFGLARADFADMQTQVSSMTDYVATRWYRAPEVILSWKRYTNAIDMWSVGTIFAELIARKPVFPGTNSQHQLKLIFDLLGTPKANELHGIRQDKARKYVERLKPMKRKKFSRVFPQASRVALDLLDQLLVFDPQRRLGVGEALAHPYLAALHCPEDEPTAEPLRARDFEFERHKLDGAALRDLIVDEIKYYGHRAGCSGNGKKRRGRGRRGSRSSDRSDGTATTEDTTGGGGGGGGGDGNAAAAGGGAGQGDDAGAFTPNKLRDSLPTKEGKGDG